MHHLENNQRENSTNNLFTIYFPASLSLCFIFFSFKLASTSLLQSTWKSIQKRKKERDEKEKEKKQKQSTIIMGVER